MPDDFTLIRNISQKTASRLHEAGILTYEKLAAMTSDEIVSRIGAGSGISAESIAKKDWIGQAAKLAEALQAKGKPGHAEPSTSNLHAVSYVVELFLDDRNTVSRTKMRHVQSEEEEDWSEWNERRLMEYFLRRPELNVPKTQPISKAAKSSQFTVIESDAFVSAAVQEAGNRVASASDTSSGNYAKQKDVPTATGKPRLHTLEIIPEQIGFPCRAFAQNQPFNVRLNLDMADVALDDNAPLNYSLTVQSRSLTNEDDEAVTKGTGVITTSGNVLLELQAAPLSPGVYQFAAALTLSPQATSQTAKQRHPATLFKGGLFEVY